MVMWIIGLSGAGKTTLAEDVAKRAREKGAHVVLVDGDVIREVFGGDLGHTLEDRRTNADRICRICKFLDDQGIHVVCAILSLFPESRQWNRAHIADYYEVFIDAPMEDLVRRDTEGLYAQALRGDRRDVAGVDLTFPPPECPDLVIRNNGSEDHLMSFAPQLVGRLLASNV